MTYDAGTTQLRCCVTNAVATLTLNRPEKRNALSDELTPALREMLARLATDPAVRCIVITGAGTAFCSGGDVSSMGGNSSNSVAARSYGDAVYDLTQRQETLSLRLHKLPKPTIAALPGPAAGAGLSIALACDLRIAAETAFITAGFGKIGLPGDYGGSWFLSRLVGPAKAKELYWLNEKVSARQCLALGIVNEVVADDELHSRVANVAADIAQGPPIAMAYMKANIDAALTEDLSGILAREADATVRCARTADHAEAVSAFLEKREPNFTGE